MFLDDFCTSHEESAASESAQDKKEKLRKFGDAGVFCSR